MLDYVHQLAKRVADVKTADTPCFFGGAVGEGDVGGVYARQYLVEIIDLDGQVGDVSSRPAFGRDADLRTIFATTRFTAMR